jgi:hypothetical protein
MIKQIYSRCWISQMLGKPLLATSTGCLLQGNLVERCVFDLISDRQRPRLHMLDIVECSIEARVSMPTRLCRSKPLPLLL